MKDEIFCLEMKRLLDKVYKYILECKDTIRIKEYEQIFNNILNAVEKYEGKEVAMEILKEKGGSHLMEIEKKSLNLIQDWINECDVDGRKICFEFFDTDARDLIILVKSIIKEIKNEM